MRVNVLRNLGTGWPSLKEGEEADVDDVTGLKLVTAGLAVAVSREPAKPIKTVPPHTADFNTAPAKSEPVIEGTDASATAVATPPSEKPKRRSQQAAEPADKPENFDSL